MTIVVTNDNGTSGKTFQENKKIIVDSNMGVGEEQLASLITIHGGALLFDVNGLLDQTTGPHHESRYQLPLSLPSESGSSHRQPMRDQDL